LTDLLHKKLVKWCNNGDGKSSHNTKDQSKRCTRTQKGTSPATTRELRARALRVTTTQSTQSRRELDSREVKSPLTAKSRFAPTMATGAIEAHGAEGRGCNSCCLPGLQLWPGYWTRLGEIMRQRAKIGHVWIRTVYGVYIYIYMYIFVR